ncbi:hypothetical protein AB0C90_38215 [Streptomyces sp. NPDC048550]|nr:MULTISPECIES: hypothetical protein [unclassified Streptomyces]MCX5151462.1 hypothetical protein [Streptomyces sp. NBC_00320]WSN54152.1 hypothetical protein OG299_41605 [Streptomyces sp. NBC_01296]WSW64293.1 hypothetical protein OG513_37645 [Streptomyces sp. NBC_00998]WSW64446.1 hypothetical protein OG513_38480 [Streptomyces sp. NBC_00998]
MTSDTGDHTGGRRWLRVAMGVVAGVLAAAGVCAIFWWLGLNLGVGAAWLSGKAAVKVGFFVAAGGLTAVTVWWQGRRASRSTAPEETG